MRKPKYDVLTVATICLFILLGAVVYAMITRGHMTERVARRIVFPKPSTTHENATGLISCKPTGRGGLDT